MLNENSFQFMADLWSINAKPWFDAHRQDYEANVLKPMKALAIDLTAPMQNVLPEFSGKPKLSRINNDIRFHQDKPMYKQHMWISFAGSGAIADIFTAIGGSGWAAGVGIGAPNKEPLLNWHTNLIKHHTIWQRYFAAVEKIRPIYLYPENPYKKALYPDAPEDIQPLLQARGVWLVEKPRADFDANPAQDFFRALCRVLPLYLFMQCKPLELTERLMQLEKEINAPDGEVGRLWERLSA